MCPLSRADTPIIEDIHGNEEEPGEREIIMYECRLCHVNITAEERAEHREYHERLRVEEINERLRIARAQYARSHPAGAAIPRSQTVNLQLPIPGQSAIVSISITATVHQTGQISINASAAPQVEPLNAGRNSAGPSTRPNNRSGPTSTRARRGRPQRQVTPPTPRMSTPTRRERGGRGIRASTRERRQR